MVHGYTKVNIFLLITTLTGITYVELQGGHKTQNQH